MLGPFKLRAGKETAHALPKKAQALLAYLAMQRGRAVPREQLAELLWGDSGDEHARRSLRQCLMSVRAALEADRESALLADGDSLSLGSGTAIRLDVADFDLLSRSQRADDLERASALYRDEFLAGLQIASQSIADWISMERRRLASAMSDVLFRLASAHLQAGDSGRAISAAERLTRFDPLREDARRLLMQLLVDAGRRSDALKQFALCAEVLRRELGVSPERATRELAESVRDGENSTTPAAIHLARASARETETSDQRTPLSLPDKPSIAVLPFGNLSADRSDDYLIDGVVEDITITLGRVPWLFVIASSSAFSYRDGPRDLRQVGYELGVRYVLRGSVRRDRDRIRIVVQLVDAARGAHVWADRFEGNLDGVFALQDQVATQVAATIGPTLHSIEIERVQRKPPESLTAYELYLRALQCFRASWEGNWEAIRLLGRAVEIDPSYGAAYGLAARCYHLQTVFGWAVPADTWMQDGFRLARLAAEIGKDNSEALWMAGHTLAQVAGEVDYGMALIERSLSLNPNSASAWISSCFLYAHAGESERALEDFARAQRLNPRDARHHVQWLAAAIAHFVAGRLDDADEANERALREHPTYPPSLRLKVVSCGLMNRLAEARTYVPRLLAVNPDASVARLRELMTMPLLRSPETLERYLEGARRAGLPGRQ